MKIHLPNSAHLQNIEGFIRHYEVGTPGLDISSHDKYIHVHPFALAMTACAAVTTTEQGHQIASSIHDVPSIPYLIRMRLFEHLGIEPPKQIVEHEEAGRFIPLTRINDAADLKRVISDLVPLLHATPAVADPIRYVFSELGRNVLEHARAGTGAFVCAQYFKDSKRIAIGIADSGVGILSSIRRSHNPANEREALYMALTPGISGATPRIGGNETNAGAGLYFIKSIAQLSENYFVIYSGSTLFKLLKSQGAQMTLTGDPRLNAHSLVTDLPHWQGTVVGIDISVDETADFGSLLNDIRRSYALDVRARKKAYYKRIRFV